MKVDGNDIGRFTNIKDHLECKRRCFEDDDCFIWTHIQGICYLKNENTFKGHDDWVSSGLRNCITSGRI